MAAKTVLVVEDDPDMRALLARELRAAGYGVRTAGNGLHAAAECVHLKPDLIVSDVHMPRMGGFEMIRILKSEPELKDIPVIFLTVDAARRERGSELGAVEYLTKPLDPEALVAAVRRHLSPG